MKTVSRDLQEERNVANYFYKTQSTDLRWETELNEFKSSE